jgi:hypothetical protein
LLTVPDLISRTWPRNSGHLRVVQTMKCKLLVPMMCLMGLTACISHTTYPIVKPITPAGHSLWTVDERRTVDSLQPTFRWKPSSTYLAPDASFDLILYQAIKNPIGGQSPGWLPGQVAYYREGLKAPQHQIETPLRANTLYIWSVRVRRIQEVSEWAGYNNLLIIPVPGVGLPGASTKDQPFLFRTPAR